jgi:hypothetical protein
MDSGLGKCDAFVTVQYGGMKIYHTDVKKKTFEPVWDERLLVPVSVPQSGPSTSDQIKIGIWDDDLASKEAVGCHTMSMGDIDSFWLEPCWIHIYGAPRELSTMDVMASKAKGAASFGLAENGLAGYLKRMNYGLEEGSAYRGRVLLSFHVDRTAMEPEAKHKGEVKIERIPPPLTIKYICLVLVLEGNGLPEHAGGMLSSSKARVEISVGKQIAKTTNKELRTGRGIWYELLLMEFSYPPDWTQVPDMFVNLLIGNERVSYQRLPMSGHHISNQLHDATGSLPDTGVSGGNCTGQGATWVDLKRDMTHNNGQGTPEFPGSLLMHLTCEPQLEDGEEMQTRMTKEFLEVIERQKKDDCDDVAQHSDSDEEDGKKEATALTPAEKKVLTERVAALREETTDLQRQLEVASKRGQSTVLVMLKTARELKDKETFGKQDPYAVVALGTEEVGGSGGEDTLYRQPVRQMYRTPTYCDAGTEVDFQEPPITFQYDKTITHLYIAVWDEEDKESSKKNAKGTRVFLRSAACVPPLTHHH